MEQSVTKLKDGLSILTINNKLELQKKGELARNVEFITFEGIGFGVVAMKNTYRIGEQVLFIEPDYCLNDHPIFEPYLCPAGDVKNSVLGKINGVPRRIRAKKFNLGLVETSALINYPNFSQSCYSQGLIFNLKTLQEYGFDFSETSLNSLPIFKEEDVFEKNNNVGFNKNNLSFPKNLYRTSETNIEKLWDVYESLPRCASNMIFEVTQKVDGSSITMVSHPNGNYICSRNLVIPTHIKKRTPVKLTQFEKLLNKVYNVFSKNRFYKTPYDEITMFNEDNDYVKHGFPYITLLNDIYEKTGIRYALRGEINGKKFKGSGNKNNPHSKYDTNILIYGVDKYDEKTDTFNKISLNQLFNEQPTLITKIQANNSVPVLEKRYNVRMNAEELKKTAQKIFDLNLIEGLVVRVFIDEECVFSAKLMNLEYDAKK